MEECSHLLSFLKFQSGKACKYSSSCQLNFSFGLFFTQYIGCLAARALEHVCCGVPVRLFIKIAHAGVHQNVILILVSKQRSLSTQLEKIEQSVIVDIKADLFVPKSQSFKSFYFLFVLIKC